MSANSSIKRLETETKILKVKYISRLTVWDPDINFVHTFSPYHEFLMKSISSCFVNNKKVNSKIITVRMFEKYFVPTKTLPIVVYFLLWKKFSSLIAQF